MRIRLATKPGEAVRQDWTCHVAVYETSAP